MSNKGAFSNNTLTLNRQAGNISIEGFSSGGAQSVNVSLTGSTLTVNVDGHSDSVSLGSISLPAIANISGRVSESDGTWGWSLGLTINSDSLGSQTGQLCLDANVMGNNDLIINYTNEDLRSGTLSGSRGMRMYIVSYGRIILSGGDVYNLNTYNVSFS